MASRKQRDLGSKSKLCWSAAIALAITTLTAGAKDNGPPAFDVQGNCRASQVAVESAIGSSNPGLFDSCVKSEQNAREELVKSWATTNAADKALCVQPTQYMASYVEWLTCLEMQKDVNKRRKENGAEQIIDSDASSCPMITWRPDGSITDVTVSCASRGARVRDDAVGGDTVARARR